MPRLAQPHPFFGRSGASVAVYVQLGSTIAVVDAVMVGNEPGPWFVVCLSYLLTTLLVWLAFADQLRCKQYPRSWAWLSVLSVAGLLVLWLLPDCAAPRGFPVQPATSGERRT